MFLFSLEVFFFSSRRRHTRCALVTGVQTCALPISGQAIKVAQRGDADVLFVHHKPSELKFVKEGFGVQRHDVMYNDFVVVGPKSDPAGIKGVKDVVAAFDKIAAAKAPFASRGDNSGTNKKGLELWRAAGEDVAEASGTWYRETGSGQGATLNTAAGMDAYTLPDRGPWPNFKNPQNQTRKSRVEGKRYAVR